MKIVFKPFVLALVLGGLLFSSGWAVAAKESPSVQKTHSSYAKAVAFIELLQLSVAREKAFLSTCAAGCTQADWESISTQVQKAYPLGFSLAFQPQTVDIHLQTDMPEIRSHFRDGDWVRLVEGARELALQFRQLGPDARLLNQFMSIRLKPTDLSLDLRRTLYFQFNQFAVESWVFSMTQCLEVKNCQLESLADFLKQQGVLSDYEELVVLANALVYSPEQIGIDLTAEQRLAIYRSLETFERRLRGVRAQLLGEKS